jgi:hypothetical protein
VLTLWCRLCLTLCGGSHFSAPSLFHCVMQDKDDEDEDLEHGKAHDDMWALDLKTHTVSGMVTLNTTALLLQYSACWPV